MTATRAKTLTAKKTARKVIVGGKGDENNLRLYMVILLVPFYAKKKVGAQSGRREKSVESPNQKRRHSNLLLFDRTCLKELTNIHNNSLLWYP